MRKLISLLLTAVLLFAACGKAGKPYLEAIEMNEIMDKQKEIYEQDIKALEERNENLLKALNDTPRPVLGAEPKPESHTVKKVILTTIGVAATALLVYCVGIFVGMQNGNEYCQNVAHKINLGGIWLCDKVAYMP
ncbi:hypothetical protein [Candidatus Endomicrobiellum agilis]|uniref:hypothetical protein n=1 Tax=Candidatus Endomicrobiellum agilis TaxID=3238957 RepID=UPI003585A166|nr:hypothetical protein [Endomicrobium sp.]